MSFARRKDEGQYLNLYFQVHQPKRLRNFHFFDVGSNTEYFDDDLNKEIFERIANNCYLPANRMLLNLIRRFPEVRVTFSISGSALEQAQSYCPEVLHSFRQLAQTGCVEFLAETYNHSLAYFISEDEFVEQVRLHARKLNELIGVLPKIFRNTELIYSNGIGRMISDLGFKGQFIDGIENVLEGRTSNALYRHPTERLILFPRNRQLSDDIAFRCSELDWSEWPLTGGKFADWLSKAANTGRITTLAMNYETLGEHKKESSGIFQFFQQFIAAVISGGKFSFVTPSQAIGLVPTDGTVSVETPITWAERARDLSAWLGNEMQRGAFQCLKRLYKLVIGSTESRLIDSYRHLQSSDHFSYMRTEKGVDAAVHEYFSSYCSPYEAFLNYMNVITDLEQRALKFRDRHAKSVCLNAWQNAVHI